ncbi:hypothetical protein Godav_000457 [Gossypium davidsonii]|uniref:Uncharacterized protein n=2 Tax=Gossypium TaxID=3633 RepID=A0A7J8SZN3_GOSDV|nr:hypothetical protein [Gossypium lobatum]MBA0631598.1 hypothetical protein [Gossypium davidsonii]
MVLSRFMGLRRRRPLRSPSPHSLHLRHYLLH